ncbi:DNA recombination protein RmuC, partial [Thioclava sp. BHET1]
MTYAAAGLAVLAILFLIGLLGAQAARRRLAAELAEVEGDLGQLRGDHTALQEELGRLRVEQATLQAEARRVPELEDQLDAERDARMTQIERLRTEKEAEARTAATLRQELLSLRESHAARLEELRDMKKELEDRFSSLAAGVLKTNSETFLGLVSERFKQHSESAKEDLEKRQQAIQNLVKPLDEKLGQFDTHIREIEKTRGEAYGAIRTQVQELAQGQQNLGQETRRLVQALRAPKTRGRWREMQLR